MTTRRKFTGAILAAGALANFSLIAGNTGNGNGNPCNGHGKADQCHGNGAKAEHEAQTAAEGPAFIAVFGQEGIVRSEELETIRNGLAEKVDVSEVELLMKMIAELRNYKVTNKLAPNYALKLVIESEKKPFDGFETYLKRFTFAKEIVFTSKPYDKGMKYAYGKMTLYIEDDISKEELEEKRARDIAFLESEIKRCEGMLNNPNFVSRAPKEKVELEKQKLAEFKKRLSDLK